jgi:hypothetical protein
MTAACPICARPVVPPHRPFCSARCRQVDLGRWFGEVYRVPVAEEPDDAPQPEGPDGPA